MNVIHLITELVYAPENIIYFEIKCKDETHRNSKQNKLNMVVSNSMAVKSFLNGFR